MTFFQRPEDNEETTKQCAIGRGGICGQACLAVIENKRIDETITEWKKMGLPWKGYTSQRDLVKYLKNKGHSVKQVSKTELFEDDVLYIARVQWVGPGDKKEKPYYGYQHWSVASAYTHYILIVENRDFFCNDTGGFVPISGLKEYLEGTEPKGIITSLLRITKEEIQNE